jgi:hypothetical protein
MTETQLKAIEALVAVAHEAIKKSYASGDIRAKVACCEVATEAMRAVTAIVSKGTAS